MKKHQIFKKLIVATSGFKQKNLIRFTSLVFCFLFITKTVSQNPICAGVIQSNNNIISSSGCGNSSTAFQNFYSKQSSYVPSPVLFPTNPIITVKLTLHIFTKTDGTGTWVNNPTGYDGVAALQTMMAGITNNTTDRFSTFRNATYSTPGFQTTYIQDSRIKFELTNIYYYPNTTLYAANAITLGVTPFTNHINAQNPGSLDEGFPIIINGANSPHQTGYNGAPIVFTSIGPGTSPIYNQYSQNNLRHEIGHGFGLGHTYDDTYDSLGTYLGGGSEWGAFGAGCNSSDYLSDVFPDSMTHCPIKQFVTFPPAPFPNPPTNPPCLSCFEFADNIFNNTSNNIMGGQPNNEWMSPLQMGRRRRALYLNYGVRKFVKDAVSDHVITKNIVASELWDFDMQMYEDIIVKSGNTLTIQCKLAMAIDGKIKVEKGAKLVIDGVNAEVTGWCKTGLWNGIQVDGTSTADQLIFNPTGYCPNQGIVEVINGGTISKAGNGITNGTTDNNGNFNWGSQGGIIICNNANFTNNARDLQFLSYQSPQGNDKSNFVNCNFKITSLLPANALPFARVTLWDVRGVSFKGCIFDAGNVYGGGSGFGIYSIDATYNIDQYCSSNTNPCVNPIKCEFNNFDNGVYVDNTNPLRVVSIVNTNFKDNIINGTYFNTVNTPIFTNNSVKTAGFNSCGLYLNNCKYYNVKNNVFFQSITSSNSSDVGIYVNNSLGGSHQIYRNSFKDFVVGIGAMHDNSGVNNITDGLKMNCNDFSFSPNAFDIALMKSSTVTTLPTVMKTQGKPNSPWLPTDVARNKYYASGCTVCENQWYIQGTSAKPYFHGSNSDGICQPLPQPALSDIAVNVVNSNIPLDYQNHCLPNTIPVNPSCPCHGCCRIADINSALGNAIAETATLTTLYNSKIDGGNTQNLLNAINGGMSNGNLKNLLEDKSPYLSDVVLSAYFNNSGVPNGHIKDIHDLNKPVSPAVWQILVNLNLPNGIMNQIIAHQNQNKVSQRDGLESQLSLAKFNLQSIAAEKLNYFITDTLPASKDSVIQFLTANIGQMQDKELLLTYAYINKCNYAEATTNAGIVANSYPELGKFLLQLISLETAPKKAFSLLDNDADLKTVKALANEDGNIGQASAQSMIRFLLGTTYSVPRLVPAVDGSGARLAIEASNSGNDLNENSSFKVYPNPASNVLNVVYQNNENKQDLQLELMDALGRVVYKTTIKNAQQIQVPLNDLSGGIYMLMAFDGKTKVYQSRVVKVN